MIPGESIPIRVFLAGYDLTPTMRDINKKFSVRYFLNLVLMDTEDRRYFKQQEITLWRKADKNRKSAITQSNNPHVPSHLVGSDGEIMKHQPHASSTSPQGQNSDGENSNREDNKNSETGEKTVGLFQEESPDHGECRQFLIDNLIVFFNEKTLMRFDCYIYRNQINFAIIIRRCNCITR